MLKDNEDKDNTSSSSIGDMDGKNNIKKCLLSYSSHEVMLWTKVTGKQDEWIMLWSVPFHFDILYIRSVLAVSDVVNSSFHLLVGLDNGGVNIFKNSKHIQNKNWRFIKQYSKRPRRSQVLASVADLQLEFRRQ